MLEMIKEPWPWYVSGPLIALIMALLILSGRGFGVSSNLRTMCTIAGAGRFSDFFRFNWRDQIWNLFFVLGAIIGGYIGQNYLTATSITAGISSATLADLQALGIASQERFVPIEIFNWADLSSFKGFMFIILGGFLVGFGTRYAGGCTSGHAISGLSNLQLPSLIAVIGFFIGGLIMTHLFMPFLLN